MQHGVSFFVFLPKTNIFYNWKCLFKACCSQYTL
jgi:hypothetical protein